MCGNIPQSKRVLASRVFLLTSVDADVPDELTGLFEGLPAVLTPIGEPTAIYVLLVVSGI